MMSDFLKRFHGERYISISTTKFVRDSYVKKMYEASVNGDKNLEAKIRNHIEYLIVGTEVKINDRNPLEVVKTSEQHLLREINYDDLYKVFASFLD